MNFSQLIICAPLIKCARFITCAELITYAQLTIFSQLKTCAQLITCEKLRTCSQLITYVHLITCAHMILCSQLTQLLLWQGSGQSAVVKEERVWCQAQHSFVSPGLKLHPAGLQRTNPAVPGGWQASAGRLQWPGWRPHSPCGNTAFIRPMTLTHLVIRLLLPSYQWTMTLPLQVREAGHMVPISQPGLARKLLQHFLTKENWSC